MQVKIYDTDAAGNEVLRSQCDLSDAFERDDDEYQTALDQLNRAGRYWAGGGAAPLVLVMRAS